MANNNRNRNISSLLFGGGAGFAGEKLNSTAPIKMNEVGFTTTAFKFNEKVPYQFNKNFSKRALSNKGTSETRVTLHTQDGKRRKLKNKRMYKKVQSNANTPYSSNK